MVPFFDFSEYTSSKSIFLYDFSFLVYQISLECQFCRTAVKNDKYNIIDCRGNRVMQNIKYLMTRSAYKIIKIKSLKFFLIKRLF